MKILKYTSLACITVFLGLFLQHNKAFAEDRYALIIGNADYTYAEKLRNPVNDANDIAASLKKVGFNVEVKFNVTDAELRKSIDAYTTRLKSQDTVGLFYYAGHAIQLNGNNYLAPINFQFSNPDDIQHSGFDLRILLDKLSEANNKANVIVLDSCRNNPFSHIDEGELSRSIKKSDRGLIRKNKEKQIVQDAGLGSMDAPINTLIAYSTKPGYVAADGIGRNSPYTEALIKAINVDGLPIAQVFADVRKSVYNNTQGKQLPWESSSLTDSFQFKTRKRTYVTPF